MLKSPLFKSAVELLAARARRHRGLDEPALDRLASDVAALSRSLLDTWRNLAAASQADAGQRFYSRFDRVAKGKMLLFTALDSDRPPPTDKASRFEAPTSMRDVEPGVDLWLQRQHLGSGA